MVQLPSVKVLSGMHSFLAIRALSQAHEVIVRTQFFVVVALGFLLSCWWSAGGHSQILEDPAVPRHVTHS